MTAVGIEESVFFRDVVDCLCSIRMPQSHAYKENTEHSVLLKTSEDMKLGGNLMKELWEELEKVDMIRIHCIHTYNLQRGTILRLVS